jgi:hypothetical protein
MQTLEEAVENKVDRLESIALKFGIDKEKLGARMRNLVKLKAKEGLIVDLDIGKWLGEVKLKDADLGITISEEERRFVSLGHQKLFPPEIVNKGAQCEARGRAALERHSFLSEEGRFVPITAWEEWKKTNEELKTAFFAVRDGIAERYDTILSDVKKEFAKRAEAVYERLSALSDAKPAEPRTAWVAAFVARLLARIPSKEDICRRFYWEERYRFLRMPSEVEEELIRTEKLRGERESLHYENEDRRRKISAMNDAVVLQLRKEKESVASEQADFLRKTMLQQRQAIVDCTSAAVAAIRKNRGNVLGSTVTALRNLVAKGRLLNFYDDPEVEQALAQIETFTQKEPGRRSNRKFGQVVSDIHKAMEGSVRALEAEATRDEEVVRIIGRDLIESVRTLE